MKVRAPSGKQVAVPSQDLGVRPLSWVAQQIPGTKQQTLICLSQGDVTKFSGDVVVNAANRQGLEGGGVNGAITEAAGAELAAVRRAELPVLHEDGTRIDVGDCKLTSGCRLPAQRIAHAVGPDYAEVAGLGLSTDQGHALLRAAYLATLSAARKVNAKSVGFSMLSSGIFKGSMSVHRIYEIAVAAVLDGVYEGLREVHLIGFTRSVVSRIEQAARDVWAGRAKRVEDVKPGSREAHHGFNSRAGGVGGGHGHGPDHVGGGGGHGEHGGGGDHGGGRGRHGGGGGRGRGRGRQGWPSWRRWWKQLWGSSLGVGGLWSPAFLSCGGR